MTELAHRIDIPSPAPLPEAPPPPTPLPRPYPDAQATPLAAPMLDPADVPHRFDRTSFSSPHIPPAPFGAEVTPDQTRPLAPPDKFAAAFVRQAVEVLLGHRPARQLQTWMHHTVFEALARRAGLAQRINGKVEKCPTPRIKTVVVCKPRDGIAEASLVLFDGHKIRAAAVRLEARRARWHVTALEII